MTRNTLNSIELEISRIIRVANEMGYFPINLTIFKDYSSILLSIEQYYLKIKIVIQINICS